MTDSLAESSPDSRHLVSRSDIRHHILSERFMISVDCTGCGKTYKFDEALVGKKARCKACSASFAIKDSSVEVVDEEPSESAKPARKPQKSKPAVTEPDDEFAGLNSVSSDGDAIEELPELPRKKKRSSSSRDDDDPPAKSKKKRKSDEGGGFEFGSGGPLMAILAASGGGIVGAIIWGMIAYFAHVEIGYVAWGIGALVGACVKFAGGDMDELFAGIIASVGSVLSILAGKLLAAVFIVQWLAQQGQLPPEFPPDAHGQLIGMAFMHSFGVMDIVFFVLAIITAFKLGSGQSQQ